MKTKKITKKNRLLATSIVTAMILSPLSAANAGFLDSLNSIRSVVSDIGYTANSVSYIELTHYLKTKKRDSPTRVLDSNETNHQRLASILERLQR